MEDYKRKKAVSVMLTQQDHDRLSRLAAESSRTLPGYLRRLLHRHFKEQIAPLLIKAPV